MYFLILFSLFFTASILLHAQQTRPVTRVGQLKKFAEQKALEYEQKKAEAVAWARLNGYPVRIDTAGLLMEIQYIDDRGRPQYYGTNNAVAATTISTDQVYSGGSAGLSLDGSGITIREWDGGGVRLTHQEYGGRVVQVDGPIATHYHSTHVAGTMMAAGVVPAAKGMAYSADLRAFDWANDDAEMANEAINGALMSNHSYGYIRGWYRNGAFWLWNGDPGISLVEDYLFGFYDADARDWDQIARNAPYYLIVKSAGNDRDEGPNGNPPNDGPYDCIGTRGIAKNLLTVGAVEDIPGGYSGPASVVMSSFSSWGPADDGRIKPDIVTNGVGLYSTFDGSDIDYYSISGTSMATPSATGSLALLQQHWENLNGAGSFMLASTLKALVIHTADEAGTNEGPDYKFGWGLMNTRSAALKISEDQVINVIDELTLNQGNTYTRTVYSDGTKPLKVTICWTDVPGTPVAAQLDPPDPMLVNDLDLRITSGATTYYPWKLDGTNPANAATNNSENNVDNVEVVYISNPVAGDYTVTVDHDGNLSGGAQTFSIIFSGISLNNTAPVANFIADNATPRIDQTVNFTDLSLNTPTVWSWSFSPATVTFVGGTDATSQNPQVQFNEGGLYTVTLVADNAFGSDTEIKTDYINVIDCTISGFPYLQTFDTWPVNSPGFSCTPDGSIPLDDCWTNMSGDDIDWNVLAGRTASDNTGPVEDHTGGGNYLYIEASDCYNSTGYASTPRFDFSTLTDPELRFWYHMYGANMGTLSVQISADGGATWSADVWNMAGDQGDVWQEAVVSLAAYALQSNIMIRFTGTTGPAYTSDIAIDDVSISQQACTYCSSYGDMTYQTSTTLVDFNTINKASGKPAGYSNYTGVSTRVVLNQTYNLTVNINTDGNWTDHTFAWIDWNQDCDFDDPGEAYDMGTATNTADGPTSASPYSITVPAGAELGTTRMRVSTRWYIDPASCDVNFDGEVEDYSVEVSLPLLTWTGNTSTDWDVASNWDQNINPSAQNNVLIPAAPAGGRFPDIMATTMDAVCYNMEIETGATLNIYGALTVQGVLINDGGVNGLVVKSDASQTGSLICTTNNVEVTVERYLTDTVAHFIGAPVNNAVIGDLFFNHNPEVWLYEFHENDNTWEYLVPLNTPMPIGKGHYVWVDTTSQDITADFPGSLYSTDLTLSTSTQPSVTFTHDTLGLNLISNPFTSAIDWDAGSWQRTNINGTVWVWSSATGNYLYRNGSGLGNLTDGIIPVSQAFFIEALAAGPVLTIPSDARVHHTQQFYNPAREIQEEVPYVVLSVSGNSGKSDETWVAFCQTCTDGNDPDRDVKKIYGDDNAPQLYAQEEELHLSIDALPPLAGEGRIVPLSFMAGENGSHKIWLADVTGMEDTEIVLEDLFTEKTYVLTENTAYNFEASVSDIPERFLIHIGNTVTGYGDLREELQCNIYSFGNDVYVRRDGLAARQTITIQLFDVYGRTISEKTYPPAHLDKIKTYVHKNIVVVRVISDDGRVISKKVYIN